MRKITHSERSRIFFYFRLYYAGYPVPLPGMDPDEERNEHRL